MQFTNNYATVLSKAFPRAKSWYGAPSGHKQIINALSTEHDGLFMHTATKRTPEGIPHSHFDTRPEKNEEAGPSPRSASRTVIDKLSGSHHISSVNHTPNSSHIVLIHRASGAPHIVSLHDAEE